MKNELVYSGSISKKHREINISNGMTTYSKPDQLIVWITVVSRRPFRHVANRKHHETFAELLRLEQATPCPVIIDTGCSVAFNLHEWHLDQIFHIPDREREIATARKPPWLMGRPSVLLGLDLWFHKDGALAAPENAVKLTNADFVAKTNIDALNHTRETAVRPKFSLFSKSQKNSQTAVMTKARKKKDDIKANIFPRLPTIGIRLLRANQLKLVIDPNADDFSLIKHPKNKSKPAKIFNV